jgi:hypothetical protein
MFTDAELERIVRDLTLLDRPFKRSFWLTKGFKRIGRYPDKLVNYWRSRLIKDKHMAFVASRLLRRFGYKQAPPRKAAYPSAAKMLGTFSKSMASWAKKGFKVVTPKQFEERHKICHSCDQWDASAMAGTGRCKVCGCSTQAKLRLATEKCPIDKWGPIQTTV